MVDYTDSKDKQMSTPGKEFEDKGFVLPGYLTYETSVDKDYVPEGFETVEDYLTCTLEDYAADVSADQENRDAALEDKEFKAGEQWDPEVLEARKGLPCFSLNTVPQFTAQVVGSWRQNKSAIRVVPGEDGDTNVASVRGDLIRAIEMKSRASRTYDDTFESTITCGDGAFRITTEYARDDVFDQDIVIKPIADALSVVWDRLSVDPTGRDAKHVFVDDVLPKREFEKKFPDAAPSSINTSQARSLHAAGWYDADSVKVTEHWRMIERPRIIGMFADGSIYVLDTESLTPLIEMKGSPIKTRVAPCSYAQMHLITGTAILAGPFEFQINRLPIIRMIGRVEDIAGRRVRYGLVRAMKDSVRLRNFWRSKTAEQLGYTPNAQWIGTESAFEGYEDAFREAHLTRDPILKVSDDAILGQNLQRVEPPAPHLALQQEALTNAQDLKDVTGIHDASLGVRSNEVSGKAIAARQNQGDVAALTYYDNANASLLEAGDVINQLIPQIYDGARIVRIIGEDETAKFIKINDPYDPNAVDLSKGNYDVAISTGASYATRRVEAAEAMLQAVQVWPQLMEIAGDLVVKAQDWPGAEKFAERLKKAMPPQLTEDDENGMNPQVAAQVQQLQAALQAAAMEIEQLKSERELDEEKLRIDWFKAITDRLEALSDHEVDNNQMSISAMSELLANENERISMLNDHLVASRSQAPSGSSQSGGSSPSSTQGA